MNHQSGVPTSVLDFRASQAPAEPPNPGVSPRSTLIAPHAAAASSSQSAPQFTSDSSFASTQRPVAYSEYSHGYPTPPSHLAALSPVNDPLAQSRRPAIPQSRPPAMDPPGASQPQRRPSASSHANPVPYPTPPTRSTALSPDQQQQQQQQRMPMMQPPPLVNAFAHTGPGHGQHPFYPPPPSQPPTPTDSRPPHPHPSHASAPQQQYAYSVPFPYPPPMSRGGPPLQTMPSQQHTSVPGNAPGGRQAVSASQQRPIPSAHASTSRQGPPPPLPYPQETQLVPSNYSTSSQVRISTSILPPLPPPPPARGPGHGGELPVLDSPEYIEELKRRVKFHEEERTRLAEAVRTLEELLARAHQQYVANAREHAEFVKQATEKNHGLRAERDTARGERDAALAECQRLRSQRDEAVHNGLGLRREQVQFQERMRELEETVERWQQTGTASLTHIQRLRGERDELKAQVKRGEAAAREAAATTAVVVPKVEGVVDEKAPDALITPKPEPLDDLELQYPPDEPEPEPMAGPSTSLPDDAATLYSAGPSTSPSTFIAWEPPPPPFEAPEDRKRTREEYEGGADADGEARPAVRARLDADADADADGGFSMGPAFPLPRDVSLAVGAQNSPVRYFMEVRRKAHG